ncbi:cell cycle histidine kinase CckA [Microbaculum marinisediminis]|uniref:histidine kinase n=1 Tax=Microbaculum marinisediminis TaxID=2931392 RepID=A0AAW5R1N2_9HYPH|nr:response regulator [Microbaculum sp. A6E488]MCT8972616.1 response regulator [Microbaculum sp. A6E488]
MTETRLDPPASDTAPEKPEKEGSIGVVILLAMALITIAVALALMGREEARPVVLGLLAFLAVVGVFSLFAASVGLVRFSDKRRGDGFGEIIAEDVPEGMLVTGRGGRILFANAAYMRLTDAERAADVRGVERAFAGDAEASEAIFRLSQAAAAGRRAEEEVRTERAAPDGEGRRATWYRIRVQPLASRGKRDLLWQVADITHDRVRQEDVFRELQRAIDNLDHAPAGFFSADATGRIRYVNATLAGWLGYDIAETETASLTLDRIMSGDSAALVHNMEPAPGEVRVETIDLDLVRRDGRTLPVRLLHRVAFDQAGNPGTSRTIVLNRSAGAGDVAETLRAAEVRFARFFNNTPLAIATVDRNGRIERTNAAFARLFAGKDRSVRNIADCVGDRDREALLDTLDAAFSGQAELKPVDAPVAGDAVRIARFYASPVEDGDGEAAIVYALDITEQKALEAQFAQGQKMQAVGQLAGGIAHDFNNVLTAIIGFSDLLLANHRPTDPSFNDIMNIKHNANRAAGLVRQLLAFSRRQTLRPQVLKLADVMSADMQVLLARLLGAKVELNLDQARDLWLIRADVNQLEQVIINLAVNARDAMPGGGKLTIRTRNDGRDEPMTSGDATMPAGEYVLLEVEDTGTGMPPEVMAKIFDPFFTTKEVGKGTGLGLSTVYGIIKQTGGFIFADSTPGKGTCFRIYLPRHVPTEEEAAPKREVAAEAPRDLTGRGTILLVEDEEAVRAFAARALASRGYTVLEADTGVAALEVMDSHEGTVDLVVSDVVMPEMDGPTLLKEVRKRNPKLKVIFVSGYAEDAFAKNLEGGEQFHFLPKPFNLKELAATVKEVMSA